MPGLNRSSFDPAEADEQVAKLVNAGFDEPVTKRLVDQETIRSELGDDQYETYLKTNRSADKVTCCRDHRGLSGAVAGLQVGDEIVNYDGERMFSLLDLQQATQAGTPGQTVIVDVQRGDSLLSFAIPRGQIGISTGRAGFGFNRRSNQ